MDLTIPETKLVAVEYPGYVKHEDRVLETLGGLEGISRQLQDTAAVLPLKFRWMNKIEKNHLLLLAVISIFSPHIKIIAATQKSLTLLSDSCTCRLEFC